MSRAALRKLGKWLLEVEMGFVWGVAGISIFVFVFAAIWYIDPALLTLVLQFRQAKCTTVSSKFLVGISNCTWTSCRYKDLTQNTLFLILRQIYHQVIII